MNYELVLEYAGNRTSEKNPKEGTVIKETDIDLSPIAVERYLSMFGFDNTIYTFVELNKTVSKFNGNYFCKYVYFDVDDDNLEFALNQARELVKNIYNCLEINPAHFFISFSGSKGFHIGLHQKLFGGISPTRKVPEQIKTLACSILAECHQMTLQDVLNVKGKYRGCDMNIYNDNRIFRTLNSINAKSGLYKIGLTSSELMNFGIEQIKELAKSPRPDYRLECPIKDLPAYDGLSKLWAEVQNLENTEREHKKNKRAESGDAFFSPPMTGNRNESLFAQACMLFDRSDLAVESVRQIISCINQASIEPIDAHELNTLVRSASKRTESNEKFGAPSKTSKDVECFNDWFDEWVEYHTGERKPLTLLFRDFNEDIENNLLGKVCGFIGSGGTRKSYAAQKIIAKNIVEYNARAVVNSAEMGKVELVNRFLDMLFDPFPEYPRTSVSEVLKRQLKVNRPDVVDMVKQASKKISDNLILDQRGGLECEDYFKTIKRVEELYGPVDILTVDGISMMKNRGSESDTMIKHSAELKSLANQKNLFIQAICHTNKESNEFIRDSKRHVRGSEKILDNFDFFLMFSNLIDPTTSSLDNILSVPGYGHIRYFNKRGTGRVINKVYSFDSITKSIEDSIRMPEEFPTYERFTKDAAKANAPDAKTRRNAVVEEPPF